MSLRRIYSKAAIVNFPIKMQNGLIEPWPCSRSNGSEQIDSIFIRLYLAFGVYALSTIISHVGLKFVFQSFVLLV